MTNRKITFREITEWFKNCHGKVQNFGLQDDHIITLPRAIELCDESNISFLTNKYKDTISDIMTQTACRLIIVPKELLSLTGKVEGKAFLIHDKPKQLLIDFCKEFLDFEAPQHSENIHDTAVLENGVEMGRNNFIGSNVYISANSKIGSNIIIEPNTVIKNATIGDNVKIGSNCTIGENGFGYSKLENGNVELFPHYGRVIIQDDVHIGSNTCIDRGSLSDTIIQQGAKIDNLVHIAHNVQIGKNTLIIACSMIAGSVVIGENSWVAPSSALRNAIVIGDNATIGIGSTVTKSVANNETVLGSPAIPLDDFVSLRKEQKKWLEKNNLKNK